MGKKIYFFSLEFPLFMYFFVKRANLSTDYFTNRQDRYWLIHDREVANYFALLFEYLKKISIPLIADDATDTEEPVKNILQVHLRHYDNFFTPKKPVQHGNKILKEFLAESKKLLKPFEETKKMKKDFAFLVPSIQMGKFSIYDDLLFDMLNNVSDESEISLATAYFNIDNRLSDHIVDSKNPWKILTASPHANGFLGSKGLSGFVPLLYLHREYEFFKNLHEKQKSNVSFHEWFKPKESYHGKGIWISDTPNSYPCISICGSSNYGMKMLFYLD